MDRQAEKASNELQIFNYNSAEVRTVIKDGEPWWVLKDVCEALNLSNPTVVADRLDIDERAKFDLGRQGETNIINESGLYNVILRSDKPEAKNFKRWITHEVLPSIRKHGAYMTPAKLEEMLMNPDAMITVLTALKDEQTKSRQLEARIKQDRPKVIFADAVDASDGTCLVGELAKMLKGNGVDMGQNRLFQVLRNKGYLIRRHGSDYNMPSQRSMDLGLFRIKETAITHSDGHVAVNRTPKVTGKGQQYFVNLFLGSQ